MSEEAATPTGGAEVSARPETSQPSIHDRIKAAIRPQEEPQPDHERPAVRDEPDAEPAKPIAQQIEEKAPVEEPAEAEEPFDESTLTEIAHLAEATGLSIDKLMDLDIPTKVDGKEGKARLRDLVKSFQLEGHLNQKLMAHSDDKKSFEAEAARRVQEIKERTEHLNLAHQLAEKLLHAEFAAMDWDALRSTDPATYNARVVEFQDRQQKINQLADALGQEKTRASKEAEAQAAAYFQEQQKLLESKIPEWSDKAKQTAEVAEMVTLLNDAYGISEAELRSVVDHRQLLLARDAFKWQQLQKQKPAITNKVKTAPKLLKPGTAQSKAAQVNGAFTAARMQLKKSGKVGDAKAVLKHLI